MISRENDRREEAGGTYERLDAAVKQRRAKFQEAYLDTLDRMEPDIAMVDLPAAAASISISLKRIADAVERKQLTGVCPVCRNTVELEEESK